MNWVIELFDKLFSIVPQMEHIPATHGGVLFGRNGKVIELLAGNRWYWPIIHSVETYPIVRTTMNLPMQTLALGQNGTWIVGGIIIYEIEDIVEAFAETYDIEDTIADIVMCTIAELLREHGPDIPLLTITKVVRRKLKPHGVKVLKMGFSDLAPALVLRNVNNENKEA